MKTALVSVLTDVEKINLLLLCMKADGLNDSLVADGILGVQSVNAAKEFIEHREMEKKYPSGLVIPHDTVTRNVLEAITPETKCTGSCVWIERIRSFFAQRGIVL